MTSKVKPKKYEVVRGKGLHSTTQCYSTRGCAELFCCCHHTSVFVCCESHGEDVIPYGWFASSPFPSSIQFIATALSSREGRRPSLVPMASRPAQQEMRMKLLMVLVMLVCCSFFHAAESDSSCNCDSKFYRMALAGCDPCALSTVSNFFPLGERKMWQIFERQQRLNFATTNMKNPWHFWRCLLLYLLRGLIRGLWSNDFDVTNQPTDLSLSEKEAFRCFAACQHSAVQLENQRAKLWSLKLRGFQLMHRSGTHPWHLHVPLQLGCAVKWKRVQKSSSTPYLFVATVSHSESAFFFKMRTSCLVFQLCWDNSVRGCSCFEVGGAPTIHMEL